MTVDTVIWPPKLALVRPGGGIAYAMRLLKESVVKGTVQVKGLPVAQGFLALEHEYLCPVTDAHYLATVLVRPLEGRSLPKGEIKVMIDKEQIIQGPISKFLPDPDPLDCTKVHRFKKTHEVCTANALNGEQATDLQHGFMAINRSKVQVYLGKLMAEEAVPLEITLVSAHYTTKKES